MYMTKKIFFPGLKIVIVLAALVIGSSAIGQSTRKEKKLVRDCQSAKADFINTDGLMKSLFTNAYGYVISPNVGKEA